VRVQRQIAFQQHFSQSIVAHLVNRQGVVERAVGQLPKVDMTAHERVNPGILQLFGAPEGRNFGRRLPNRTGVPGDGRVHVEDGSVGIEYAGNGALGRHANSSTAPIASKDLDARHRF
jgi:hypothetical protein